MYGGLIYSDDPNTFKHYWDHGDVKILAHGSNGVTCLVTVPGGKTFLNEHGKKVDTILIKLVPIKSKGSWVIELPSKERIEPASMESVRNEYAIQKWLYERALHVLKYELCPCPTGIVVMKVADVEAKITGLTVHHDPALHLLHVGVIVMQYIANYDSIIDAPRELHKVLMAKSRRLLVDAYSIGVIHGDPIRGNFLWNKDKVNPNVIMIDLGAASKRDVTSTGFTKNGVIIRPIHTYPAFAPILARLNDVHDPKATFPDLYYMAVLVINLMYSKNVVEFWRHQGCYYYAWVISDQNKEIQTPFRTTPWALAEHPFSHKEGFTAWIDSDNDYRVVDKKWAAAVKGYQKMMNLR
jgi:hypothetical protein